MCDDWVTENLKAGGHLEDEVYAETVDDGHERAYVPDVPLNTELSGKAESNENESSIEWNGRVLKYLRAGAQEDAEERVEEMEVGTLPAPVDLRECVAGDEERGAYFILDYSVATFKKAGVDTPFIKGQVSFKGCVRPFTVWDGVHLFKDFDIRGYAVIARGAFSLFRNELQVTLDSVDVSRSGEYDRLQFEEVLPYESLFTELGQIVTKLPAEAMDVVNLMFSDAGVVERFKTEYAGQKMHDAAVGGLIHHTVKMLRILDVLIQNDPLLEEHRTLLTLGIIFHDLGKIDEMQGGEYKVNSFVSHRAFGVIRMAKHEDVIRAKLGDDIYYRLIDIIQGHHGEYGERPHTVWTYIVHLIDNLESQTTGMLNRIQTKDVKAFPIGDKVWTGSGELWV